MIFKYLPRQVQKLLKIGMFNPKNYGFWGERIGISSDTIITSPKNVYLYGNNGLKRAIVMTTNAKFVMKKNSGASYGLVVATGNHARIVGTPYRCITEATKPKGLDADVIVEEDVWIGMNVIIMSGVTIGRGSNIGAGSVVRNSVPPYSVVIGNPAKVVGFTFNPSQIIEHECILYPEDERIPKEVLEKNYNDFYGISGTQNNTSNQNFTMDDYRDVFSNIFSGSRENVEEAEYKQTEGWDSVGHMSLIAAVEQKFGISLKPEDFLHFHSYQKGIEILQNYGISFEEAERMDVEFPKELFDFSSFPDNIAIQTDSRNYTYKDLDESAALLSKHVEKSKVAFLLAKNTIGSIAAYVGCIKNNIPVAVLDAHKDSDFIGAIIDKYHPEYLLLPADKVKEYKGEVLGNIYDYAIVHLESTNYAVSKDLSLLLTTSGSTGSPKFVRLTKKNIQSNAESIARYLGLSSNERPITSLPMYYSYGISIINSHFTVGATLILTEESVVSPSFWQLAKEQQATSVSGVPYTYDMFKQMRVMDMDIPSLKTFTQAGGKMNKENVSFFADNCKQKGRKLIVMYGQTEASPRISYLPFDKAVEKSDSIGIPIPGVDLSISEDGELICKGDNVFQGYAESYEDLAKGDEVHGVLYTGDMARKDDEGFFYITGRKKRFVKVYGNRVGLDELEQLIMPVYGKVVCVGVDDHVTIYTTDKHADLKEIETYIAEKSKINSNAFSVVYIAEFPYSNTGKIEYTKLKVIQ